MRYPDHILEMYQGIFDDAYSSVKEAGIFQRMGRGIANVLQPRNKALLEEVQGARAAAVDEARLLKADNEQLLNKILDIQKQPNTWRNAAIGLGAGVPLAGYGAYRHGKNEAADEAEAERLRTRNVAFGTGLAGGLIAPQILGGLGTLARGASGSGLFPEFQPGMQY